MTGEIVHSRRLRGAMGPRTPRWTSTAAVRTGSPGPPPPLLRPRSEHRIAATARVGPARVRRRAAEAGARAPARPGQRGDPVALCLGRVGAARVEALVARHEVRPVRREPIHEDLAHLAAQVQADAADVDGARLAAQLEDLLDLLRRVVDPRHERRDQDAAGDALTVQLGDRLDPLARMRRVRLARPPGPLVERRNREIRGEAGNLVDLLHEVDVAEQQRRLREHRRRRARVAHRLPDARHQLVAPLDPLVRIGVGPERDVLALPRRPHQLRARDLGDVHLDDDLLLEVPVRVEVEVGVGGAGEAVVAHNAVGDEVTAARGDVEQLHLAQGLDLRNQ